MEALDQCSCELFPLLGAMEARASQPKVAGEEEAERFHSDPNMVQTQLPRLFPNEQRFPVLLVSLQGPQHGRILYACMEGGRMLVFQSALYRFAKKETAPWDLFARWMLSTPLAEHE